MNRLRGLFRDANGATAIEYGLICALIGVAITASLTNVTAGLGATFGAIGNVFSR